MQGHKVITWVLHKDVELMDYKEWIKFGTHTNIIPHVLSSKEMTDIFWALQQETFNKETDEEKK